MQRLTTMRLQLPGNTLSQFIAMAQRTQSRCCCSALPSGSIASASASTHWHDERRRPRRRPSHSVACVADASAAAVQQPADIDTQAPESDAAPAKAKKPLVMPTPILPTAQLADVEGLFANGALLIDKPLEWTSFDVCAKVRNTLYRFLGKLKVGASAEGACSGLTPHRAWRACELRLLKPLPHENAKQACIASWEQSVYLGRTNWWPNSTPKIRPSPSPACSSLPRASPTSIPGPPTHVFSPPPGPPPPGRPCRHA